MTITEDQLSTYLFDNEMSVDYLLPLALLNSEGSLDLDDNDDLVDLAQNGELSDLIGLTGDHEINVYLKDCATVSEVINTLMDFFMCKGYFIKLSGRMFERSGLDSWSSTGTFLTRYAYSKTLDGIIPAIYKVASDMQVTTFPQTP